MKTKLLTLTLLFAVLLLAGCEAVGAEEPTSEPLLLSEDAEQGSGNPAAGGQLLRNEEHGYSLQYPAAYTVEHPNPDETVLGIIGRTTPAVAVPDPARAPVFLTRVGIGGVGGYKERGGQGERRGQGPLWGKRLAERVRGDGW